MTGNKQPKSPAELRGVFGENLRTLTSTYPSVTALCRTLGVNRTQFNRYLSGESFPRPDILARICAFFDVDARILLIPLDQLEMSESGQLSHSYLRDWLGPKATHVPESMFPSGFYRFSRRGLLDDSRFVQGLVIVRRQNGHTFMRGLEPREALRQQGLSDTPLAHREFRGAVLRQDDGISILISRRGGMTGSFNFLSPVASYENNYWEGYVARTVRSQSAGRRFSRLVYEHLGTATHAILQTARHAGYCGAEDLLEHHLRLLQDDQPIA
ncbi:helix-turn-helix domain-containing protein [Lutimaribacter sp. EGI FJ00015]|uniref:Helix-turn-helix domain-containing protein n=1 Tax=Lutimaribacter degradans TaxID=2945989 RepID=A0ACC5ZVM6_9RHOB|nr:helix-turn-helix transcriptional regulator [Lutimaribacter sp. EGI FJ00013]MCM2562387.1 helix-turn-helix domain-containing protein [Lutimaribacter sp. EGI FJ00013]MCO0613544.1 helix-turn-helix domain-containing protein [Lutimaribacter sp. EGI FJ00015]MCO0636516.1 helix-turn-helix domain-containing protein [Lutimaribacter sp. EGI FJ00014]